MDKVFVKVNGTLWVKNSWSNVGTLFLTEKDSEKEPIDRNEIKWLQKRFGKENVKAYEVKMVEVPLENEDTLKREIL
jgi:hypothetical protein